MNGPPGNSKSARQGAQTGKAQKQNVAKSIDDPAVFRNHRIVEVKRCLSEDWWLWLIWHAGANDGGAA
jgi:hypothetical protein